MPRLTHLSDEELVRALDGELSPHEQALTNAHLSRCDECSRRRAALAACSDQVAALHASADTDRMTAPLSRARLRAAIAADARYREASSFARLNTSPLRVSHWLGAAAAIVAVTQLAGGPYVEPASPRTSNDALPIAALTPGAAQDLPLDELCSPTHPEARPIASDVRAKVLRAYGMERVSPDAYELDYLITPELGGAPTAENLWPQLYGERTWNASVKDQLEDLLPTLVCGGRMTLQAAQRDLADDWIAAYKRHFRTDVPLTERAARGVDALLLARR